MFNLQQGVTRKACEDASEGAKRLDRIDHSDKDATKIFGLLLERVRALDQQAAKLSKD